MSFVRGMWRCMLTLSPPTPRQVNEATVKEFAGKVLDGTAEVEFKSAAIPAEPKDEGVAVIVGKNFTQTLIQTNYSSHCGIDPCVELFHRLSHGSI